jgi:hypothetical protein
LIAVFYHASSKSRGSLKTVQGVRDEYFE